jgi:hypothetical protein
MRDSLRGWTPRKVFTFGLGILMGAMVASCPAEAQTPADSAAAVRHEKDSLVAFLDSAHVRLDSLSRVLDSLPVKSPPREDNRLPNLMMARVPFPTETYATGLVLGVAANAIWKLDQDPGGYPDKWLTMDKAVHLNVAHFLTARSMRMGVHPGWAFGLTCAAAIAFEKSQGYVSSKDIAVGCAGSGLAVVERWLAKRVRF